MRAIDRSMLPQNDALLLNAALQIAFDIRKPMTASPVGSAENKPPPTPARLDLTASAKTLATAQRQLEQLELLTKDRRP
jgi:chemotaxis protein MotC